MTRERENARSATEALARAMHESYVREQRARGDGRRTNPSLVAWEEADESLRESSPLLVPWSELSEEERDKDRDAVRNLPEMLLRAGFVIDRG